MREIKFRGYSDYYKMWYYGYIVKIHKRYYMYNTYGNRFEIIPETVGQFTGLHDKNGKEIYEGDLCLVYDPYNGLPALGCARVVFSYAYIGGWVLISGKGDLLNIGTRTKYIEVIGNIYENPELLNDNKKID